MAKPADAQPGHNSMTVTDDDKQVLFFIHRNERVKLLAAKKAADAALKNHGKKVKADLGEHGMAQIKLYEELRTPEGEARFKAQRAAEEQAARWAGLPIDTQVDMFTDLAPLDERAFAEGEESGLRGDTFSNPFDPNSEAGRRFDAGWKSGQAKLGAGIKKLEQKAADELIKAGGDPEFPDPDNDDQQSVEAAE